MPPIFISLAHYFPYDVKLRLLAHSRGFLANQKARNAIVGAENLQIHDRPILMYFQLREYTLPLESYHAETRVSHTVTTLTPIFAIK